MIQPINCAWIPAPFNIVCQEINVVIGALNSVESAIVNGLVQYANAINNNTINVGNAIRATIVAGNNGINANITNAQNNIINRIVSGDNLITARVNSVEANILNTVNARANSISQQISGTESRIITSIYNENDKLANIVRSGDNTINSRLDSAMQLSTNQYNDLKGLILKQGNVDFKAVNQAIDEAKSSIEATIGRGLAVTDAHIVLTSGAILGGMAAQTAALTGAIAAGTATTVAAVAASKIPELLTQTAPDIISILTSLLGGIGLVSSISGDVNTAAQRLNGIWIKLQENGYDNYDDFVNDLESLGVAGSLTQTLWNLGKFLFVVSYGTLRSFEPFIENIVRLARSQANSQRLSSAELLTAFHKIQIPLREVETYFKGLGYSDIDVTRLLQLSYTVLSPDMIKYLYLHDKINEETHDLSLQKLGYAGDKVRNIKDSYFVTPPAQDLITMAVREAFTPEIANAFGQYEGYPEVLTEYLSHWGIDDTWAKAYWAAHWRLPSAEEGFQMLHRGIINQDTLKLLLRALDIMPYWRDKVIDLSYSPLRLVDIRRFYELGVIDEAQMFTEYKSRGYDDKHARWATNWTIQYVSGGNETESANRRLLSQAVIVKAYNAGKMNKEQAIAALIEAKYTREDATLIIELYTTNQALDEEKSVLDDNNARIKKYATDAYGERLITRSDAAVILASVGYEVNDTELELDSIDYERELKIKGLISDWFRDLYVGWQTDREGFIVNLSQFGFEPDEIDRLLAEYDVVREVRTRKPTIEQVERWRKAGILSDNQYINELKGLGFADNYVTYFAVEKGLEGWLLSEPTQEPPSPS